MRMDFKRMVTNGAAVLGSYGMGAYSMATHLSDFVSMFSVFAGGILTIALALVHYANYKMKMEETRSLKLKNDLEFQNQKKNHETQ